MNNHKNNIVIINGIIISPFVVMKDKSILLKEGKIASIEDKGSFKADSSEVIDAKGNYIVPGFIDLHVHGGGGSDTMDGDYNSICKIAQIHSCYGTTSFLSTTMTMSKKHILKSLGAVKEASDKGTGYANVLGVHLEGPYINEAMKGAQNKEYIKAPVIDEFQQFKDVSGNLIKIVTIAPELPGASDFIRWLKSRNIIASAGHTNATYEQMMDGISAGISHVTHTFNAMTGLHHRNPGVVGAALSSPELAIELIADGIHVHPAVMKILVKAKEKDKTILITDAIRAAGLPPGRYDLGGQTVIADKNEARLEDGTLAGSVLTMEKAVRNIKEKLQLPLETAIQFATNNPAKCLGIEDKKGTLSPGMDADIVILNKELQTEYTIAMGKVIFNRNEI